VKKMDKVDGLDKDNTEFIKLELFMDLDNPESKYSRHFSIFKDGRPEEWVKFFHVDVLTGD
jgi:hypothetical protein